METTATATKKTHDELLSEIGELSLNIGKLIAMFFNEYCSRNPGIKNINDVGNIKEIKENLELYRIPLVCVNLGEILRFHADRDYWASMINALYMQFRQQNFTTYDAVKNALDIFTLKWNDETRLPTIDVLPEDEINKLQWKTI